MIDVSDKHLNLFYKINDDSFLFLIKNPFTEHIIKLTNEVKYLGFSFYKITDFDVHIGYYFTFENKYNIIYDKNFIYYGNNNNIGTKAVKDKTIYELFKSDNLIILWDSCTSSITIFGGENKNEYIGR